MFSKELKKENAKPLIKQKRKKLNKQKNSVNNLFVQEQINCFAEIIVNNLLKDYNNENR